MGKLLLYAFVLLVSISLGFAASAEEAADPSDDDYCQEASPEFYIQPPLDVDIPVDNKWGEGVPLSAAPVIQTPVVFHCAGGNEEIQVYYTNAYLSDTGNIWHVFDADFHVYDSKIPGVGFIVGVRYADSSDWVPVNSSSRGLGYRGYSPDGEDVPISIMVWYVTTGAVKPGHYDVPSYKLFQFYAVSVSGSCAAGSKYCDEQPGVYLQGGGLDIAGASCSIIDVANVKLGAVPITKYFKGVGSVGPTTFFSIPLQCDGEVAIDMYINGSGAIDTTKGVLNLASGGATGVGIQMLRDDGVTPVRLGSDVRVIDKTAPGRNDLSLAARYYQSSTKVVAGKASRTVQFNLRYR